MIEATQAVLTFTYELLMKYETCRIHTPT